MASITIHTCGEESCGYYQEPYNDYPERGMNQCMGCSEYFCDECTKDHAVDCMTEHYKNVETKCDWCENTHETDDIFKCGLCEESFCYDCGVEHANECYFG